MALSNKTLKLTIRIGNMLDLNLKHLKVQKLPYPEVLILTANAGVPQRGSPFLP
jgi:hypothetical protein